MAKIWPIKIIHDEVAETITVVVGEVKIKDFGPALVTYIVKELKLILGEWPHD